ncbi:hypothetical protein [Bacillus badius]|uniref:hypothetical protein n=1 Tax=Bacillus badius TaxID=1455 RepID=UPI000597DE23|nr:hypothetical protein [Bacillus badius]KIL74348.1 hypothetical protein SD78_1417 [Bacillus badius]
MENENQLVVEQLKIKETTFNVITTSDLMNTTPGTKDYFRDWDNTILLNELDHKDTRVISVLGHIMDKLNDDNYFSTVDLQKLTKGLYLFFFNNPQLIEFIEEEEEIERLNYAGMYFDIYYINGKESLDQNNNFIIIDASREHIQKMYVLVFCLLKIASNFMSVKMTDDKAKNLSKNLFKVLVENEGLIKYLCSMTTIKQKERSIRIGHREIWVLDEEDMIGIDFHDVSKNKINQLNGRYSDKFRSIALEKNLSNRRRVEVFLHELLHSANKYCDIDYTNKDNLTPAQAEESVVIQLANVLSMVLLENPHLSERLQAWKENDKRRTEEEIMELVGKNEIKKSKYEEALATVKDKKD